MTTTPTSPPPSLPTPSTFDILPPLHSILSRLLLPTPQNPSPNATPTPASATNSFPAPNNSFPPASHEGPLNPKDLAAAVSEVRARIQEARRVVEGLPMGEMTVEELEAGVEEGEAEVRRLSGEKVGGEGGLLRGGVK